MLESTGVVTFTGAGVELEYDWVSIFGYLPLGAWAVEITGEPGEVVG